MSSVSELTQTAQEQTLAAVKQSQQLVVDAVRTWAETVEKAVPEVPNIPLADSLTSPEELVTSSFAFAEQLLQAQRDFAVQVVAAASPVIKTAGTKPAKAKA
jgi:hypothetical protein